MMYKDYKHNDCNVDNWLSTVMLNRQRFCHLLSVNFKFKFGVGSLLAKNVSKLGYSFLGGNKYMNLALQVG
jgi:hypothetical protein